MRVVYNTPGFPKGAGRARETLHRQNHFILTAQYNTVQCNDCSAPQTVLTYLLKRANMIGSEKMFCKNVIVHLILIIISNKNNNNNNSRLVYHDIKII